MSTGNVVGDPPAPDLSKYPWATLMVVFMSLVGGVVVLLGNSSLEFDKYLTIGLGAASALSIGRGLAYKATGIDESPVSRFLNSVPWSTMLVFIYASVGAVVLIIGESDLNFEGYVARVMGAATLLGVGRGIAAYKKDNVNIDTGTDYSGTPPQYEDVPPVDGPEPKMLTHPDDKLTGDIDPPSQGV